MTIEDVYTVTNESVYMGVSVYISMRERRGDRLRETVRYIEKERERDIEREIYR